MLKFIKQKGRFYHTIVANLFEMVSLSFGRRKIERKKKKYVLLKKRENKK